MGNQGQWRSFRVVQRGESRGLGRIRLCNSRGSTQFLGPEFSWKTEVRGPPRSLAAGSRPRLGAPSPLRADTGA